MGGAIPSYPSAADTLYMQVGWLVTHFEIFVYMLYLQQAPTYQSLYPGVDNRYLAATDYFAAAGYRSLGTYYPEYAAHAALGNSYLDVSGGNIERISWSEWM